MKYQNKKQRGDNIHKRGEYMQDKTKRLLQGLYNLDHNIKLYIPSTQDINKTTDNSKQVKKALELFGGLFGGATEYQALGSWVSDKLGLVVEKVTIVESYATAEQVESGLETVIKHGQKIKKEMNQEAVSLEYDNKLYFI